MTAPAQPQRGFDPEAEQEVDFARYVRLLAVRWWLLAAGVVAGAVIGFLVSLGGSQVYSASATVYLGQAYNGSVAVITPQANPSAVGAVIQSRAVDDTVANECRTKASRFASGISSQAISTGTSSSKSTAPVVPLVKVSVQAKKGKLAACAANRLADKVVTKLGSYPAQEKAALTAHLAFDNADIQKIQAAIGSSSVSSTDKLILGTLLRTDQLDKTTTQQTLLLVKQVELPKVLTRAASQRVTARSRRNTVLIAALIGLILGAIAALLWDRVVPRLMPRNGNGIAA